MLVRSRTRFAIRAQARTAEGWAFPTFEVTIGTDLRVYYGSKVFLRTVSGPPTHLPFDYFVVGGVTTPDQSLALGFLARWGIDLFFLPFRDPTCEHSPYAHSWAFPLATLTKER